MPPSIIAEIDAAIKDALTDYHSQACDPKARPAYLRRRNALYSKRKYHLRKSKLDILSNRVRELQELNDNYHKEQQRLEQALGAAHNMVQLIDSPSTAYTSVPHVTPITPMPSPLVRKTFATLTSPLLSSPIPLHHHCSLLSSVQPLVGRIPLAPSLKWTSPLVAAYPRYVPPPQHAVLLAYPPQLPRPW